MNTLIKGNSFEQQKKESSVIDEDTPRKKPHNYNPEVQTSGNASATLSKPWMIIFTCTSTQHFWLNPIQIQWDNSYSYYSNTCIFIPLDHCPCFEYPQLGLNGNRTISQLSHLIQLSHSILLTNLQHLSYKAYNGLAKVRLEGPCNSLTNPRKLNFPSVCLIQSWRTAWTGTDGLRPSSWNVHSTRD